jgi:hypothetical protein
MEAEATCGVMNEFNLAATAWLRGIPPHLSFDSEHNVNWMMVQSGTLASYFYQCQVRDVLSTGRLGSRQLLTEAFEKILANRPVTNVNNNRFLEQRRAASAACDAAAKATCRVVYGMQRRSNLHQALCSSIMSACIIRLHSTFGSGLEASSVLQINEALADVQMCVNALSELELR